MGSLLLISLLLLFLFTSLLPSITLAKAQVGLSVSQEKMNAMIWIRDNTEENSIILAPIIDGYLINAIAKRDTVIKNSFLFVKNAREVLDDINSIYTTRYSTDAVSLLSKYSVNYILIDENTKHDYEIDDLYYSADGRCFEKVYSSTSLKIYKSVCILNG